MLRRNRLSQPYTVLVSHLEIYNEELCDLLGDDNPTEVSLQRCMMHL